MGSELLFGGDGVKADSKLLRGEMLARDPVLGAALKLGIDERADIEELIGVAATEVATEAGRW